MKEKIKELFAMLPRNEQLELLRELTSSNEFRNPIVELSELSQQQFGKNIEFSLTNTGNPRTPLIMAQLTTPWGVFEADGTNQKIAKAKAADIALLAIQNSNELDNPQFEL